MRHLYLTSSAESLIQPSQRDAIELAALECSYQFLTVDKATALTDQLKEQRRSLAICSASDYAELITLHDRDLSEMPQNIVLLNPGDDRNEPIRNLLVKSAPSYVLGLSSPSIMRSLLGSILEFTIGRGFRGITPRLANANGLQTESHFLRSSTDRASAQKFALNHVRQIVDSSKSARIALLNSSMENPGISPGASFMTKVLADILDELLMNAIWDANPKFKTLSRSETCYLEEGKEVLVETSSDGTTISLTVEDREGTLNARSLKGPIAYALGLRPELKVNEGPGGAGLGLFMILQRTSIISFEVSQGQYTRVCAVMRLDDSARDMQSRPKSIFIFESVPEAAQTVEPLNKPA